MDKVDEILFEDEFLTNVDDLLQITPVPSIKKNRKRKLKNVNEEEEEEKEYEKNGIFFYEKQKFITSNDKKIMIGMSLKEKYQLNELIKSNFYTLEHLQIVVDLNNEKSQTPRLRSYDWAVTNFSKMNRSCSFQEGQATTLFDPYSLYVGELKRYHRLLFDPFRRGTHVFFEHDEEIQITTVGQLNFIKWCIENNIDKYVESNLSEIKLNMSFMSKKRKLEKENKLINKKQHFSVDKKILKTGFYQEIQF